MDQAMHPRMRARIEAVERARALKDERELFDALSDVEEMAALVDARVGTSLSETVADACDRFRRTLSTHGRDTPAGRLFRKLLPDRLRELRDDCETTERVVRARTGRAG